VPSPLTRTSRNGRKFYRQPAYLLTTDLTTPAAQLIQEYFDRWGIEVNHRDEKEIIGVGEAQVWNRQSVSKVPALLVAMYSWLILAGLHCYGPKRTQEYQPLPKWRRAAKRPSCLDLITLLRQQMVDKPVKFANAERFPTAAEIVVEDIPVWIAGASIPAHAYVVIVTRGHTNDLEALRALATRDLRYLGLIGSRAKVARIYHELVAAGMFK
jgi:hypothetical protein